MRIRDVMTTDPRTCLPADTAFMAASIMKEMETGIVPIIENQQSRHLVGVVTDRDLCLWVIAGGRDPHATALKECMVDTVVSCAPEDDVQSALALMQDHQIRRIPVVDKQRILQGIVSFADLMQRVDLPPPETHQAMKQVTQPQTKAVRRKTG
jgi:CBS domain-containing protein